jgi:precorrin-8X/cobalt-precorrin-8 methylmutase
VTAPLADDYGIVIAGHGSRDADGVREFELLVELVKQRSGRQNITHGFLEFARPTIAEAVRSNIAAGAQRLAIVPGVLLTATHAKNDMPSEVVALQKEFSRVQLHYGAALHLHPQILRLIRKRIVEAEARSANLLKRSDTCLLVVGRGTTDPDANSDVSKLARMLEEGLGFGASFVCYSGTAKPLVADGLQLAARLGFARIIVVPFFLFTGILVKRIYAAADALALGRPDIEVLKCDYLGIHEHIADAFLDRAVESIAGKAAMNCSLCKYRVQIVGYEKEVGTPQGGQHFHLRAANGVNGNQAPEQSPTRFENSPTIAYEPHRIEAESFRIIEAGHDWSKFSVALRDVLQRLVHTTGDFDTVDDIFISQGAVEAGTRALLRYSRIVTDVTMVQSGLRRALLQQLSVSTTCLVHDEETKLLAVAHGLTRSAAGIRRAWMQFGNDVIVAIGDAPTALEEAVRLVNEWQWRPHLIIGLPVGFVATRECKENLRGCLRVPRITNRGTRGGSPWAAAVVNAMLIRAANQHITSGSHTG